MPGRFEGLNVLEAGAETERLWKAGVLTPDELEARIAEMQPMMERDQALLDAKLRTALAAFTDLAAQLEAGIAAFVTAQRSLDICRAAMANGLLIAEQTRQAMAEKPANTN